MKLCAAFLAVLTAVFCIFVLYHGTNIGLADNGDYRRVMMDSRITYQEAENNTYMFRQYYNMEVTGSGFFEQFRSLFRVGEEGFYSSPHQEIVRFSKVLNYFYNLLTDQPLYHYNILWLAMIYIAMFGHGCYMLFSFFKKFWQQLVVFAFVLFFFCDAGYILYFNSFFGEALQFVAVFMLCALMLHLIRKPDTYGKLVLFYIYLYLFAGAKLVNVLTAVVIALATLFLLLKEHGRLFRYVLSGLVAVVLFSCVSLYVGIPEWMDRDTNYQAVFYGVLKQSKTPEQDLEELGLDPSYAVLENTNAYMATYPIDVNGAEFENGFHNKISKFKVAAFYLKHPVRFTQKLAIAIENSAHIRPTYLGTSPVYRVEQTNRWSGWSTLRVYSNILYEPIIVLPFLFIFSVVVLVLVFRAKTKDSRLYRISLLVVLAGLWINLMVQIVGNGEADLAKHMFLFIQLFDILIVWGLLWCVLHARMIVRNPVVTGGVAVMLVLLVAGGLYQKPVETLEFGTWNGVPILWDVISENPDGTIDLISHDILCARAFDTDGVYGNNLWQDSDIRAWLNAEFLQSFTDTERAKLRPIRKRVLLSMPNIDLAEGGDHPHFWTPVPSHTADLSDSAYYYTSEDMVTLPSIDQVEAVRGRVGGAFWLSTPYAAEGAMVRQVEADGFVLRKDANRTSGIRPVLRIEKTQA